MPTTELSAAAGGALAAAAAAGPPIQQASHPSTGTGEQPHAHVTGSNGVNRI